MESKGILTVISGFSGAGKGTIMNTLLSQYENYALSISATTRNPREGETDGVEYFFKSRDEFEKMIYNHELIEYAEYIGNYYGTPKAYVDSCLQKGKDVLLEIEMQGGMIVKKQFPDAVLVFVTTPSAERLFKQLSSRGTETEEVIKKRINRAKEEAEFMKSYDYIVMNDKVDIAAEKVHSIIQSEKNKVNRYDDLITRITKELIELKEGLDI